MSVSFELRSSALPSRAEVAAFRGSEGISRPYVLDVHVVIAGDDEVELDDAPGARATFTIHGATPVLFHGIVARIELVRAVRGYALYLVRIVPSLWQLSQTRHSRVFTKKTIPEVIAAVLGDEGVTAFELRLSRAYEPEEHVCQYKESSLSFIQRWMEREGLYYYFEQDDDGEKLVITDDKATASVSRLAPVPYHPAEGDRGAGAHFDAFAARHSSLPASVRFTDYDYTKPQLDVMGASNVSHSGVGAVVTHGGRFFSSGHGAALAQIRAEDLRAQGKTYHASGPVSGITSGFHFVVEGHAKPQLNGPYLAVAVEHFGQVASLAETYGKAIARDYDDTYRVDVTAISATQQYRHPETTPWPRIDGYENGTIDGAASSTYAQLDDHGRYAVKFKFDEGTATGGKASTWVRKMQPHAGAVEGWHFPERKGTEVICAFLGGDPDRPIIVGAVPTAATPSPVTASNHTKNVIQTGGMNRLELEDLAGQERVTLTTPHANTKLLIGSASDGHELIAKTDARALLHSGDKTDFKIGSEWTIDVGSHKSETIAASYTQIVHEGVQQTFKSTQNVEVTGAVELNHLDDYIHKVAGDAAMKVIGDHLQEIAGKVEQNISGDHLFNLIGNKVTKIAQDEARSVGGQLELKIAGISKETSAGKTEKHDYWELETGPITWKGATKNECVLGATSSFFGGARSSVMVGASFSATAGASVSAFAGLNVSLTAGYSIHGAWGGEHDLSADKSSVAAVKTDTNLLWEVFTTTFQVNATAIEFLSATFGSKAALVTL